jgi:hypothetical protein
VRIAVEGQEGGVYIYLFIQITTTRQEAEIYYPER